MRACEWTEYNSVEDANGVARYEVLASYRWQLGRSGDTKRSASAERRSVPLSIDLFPRTTEQFSSPSLGFEGNKLRYGIRKERK